MRCTPVASLWYRRGMFRRRSLRALGRRLTVITMSYAGTRPPDCAAIARPIFRALAPYITDPVQLLFARDNPSNTDGKHINGSTYFRSETLIDVPAWPADRPELTAVIAHELHHMARWQNAGYGTTLGGALLSEGFASWFEVIASGWKPRYVDQRVSRKAMLAAAAAWNTSYDHQEWFYDGPLGKRIGYSLGFALVTRASLGTFDLQASITDGPTPVYLKALKAMEKQAA